MAYALLEIYVLIGILDLMSNNKHSYFRHRNQSLSLRKDRHYLGVREVKTLQQMLQFSSEEHFLEEKFVLFVQDEGYQ